MMMKEWLRLFLSGVTLHQEFTQRSEGSNNLREIAMMMIIQQFLSLLVLQNTQEKMLMVSMRINQYTIRKSKKISKK